MTIAAAASHRAFGAVTETLPAGFDYSSSSLPQGQVLATGRKVRFILQYDDSFRYTVAVSGTPGKNSFRGIPTDSDRTDYPVAGASKVTVQRAGGPGPTNNPPTFSGDQATRSVPGNTGSGMKIGARVSATDPDGDTPTYPQGGTDGCGILRCCRTDRPVANQRCAGLGNQVQPHRDRNRDRSGRRRRHHQGAGSGDQRGREGDGDPVGDAPQVRRGGNLHPSRPGQRRHGHNPAGGTRVRRPGRGRHRRQRSDAGKLHLGGK